MVEYLISAKDECSHEWFDQVSSHTGVIERTRDMKYLWIKTSEYIAKNLMKQFSYLKFEYVID